MITFEELNDLYNLLDLYIVAQELKVALKIVECAIIKTLISMMLASIINS